MGKISLGKRHFDQRQSDFLGFGLKKAIHESVPVADCIGEIAVPIPPLDYFVVRLFVARKNYLIR